MTIKDGGSAFPVAGQAFNADLPYEAVKDQLTFPSPGMSLRDYFAAKAMQAYLSRELPHTMLANGKAHGAEYANVFYEWADAMLKAREQ